MKIISRTAGAWPAALLLSFAPAAWGATILEVDFDGRTVSGNTASNITYITNGVADPGDLSAFNASNGDPVGLRDTFYLANAFAPNINTGNVGQWTVSIPLTLTLPELTIEQVILDGVMFNAQGANQQEPRSTRINVSFVGSISGEIAFQETATNDTGGPQPLPGEWISPVIYDFTSAPLVLHNTETWQMVITTAGSIGGGNHTGLTHIEVTGVPEPTSLTALSLGGLALLRRQRKDLIA